MKLSPSFDPERKRIVFNIECNLLDKYYSNFAGLILNSPNVPEGIDVEKDGNGSAVISFPMGDLEQQITNSENDNEDFHRIAIDSRKIAGLTEVINEFVSEALKRELKTTEFLPLRGYPESDLKKDVRQAVKNDRTFCIIGEYQEYLDMNSRREYKFHQVVLEPGTEEYSDVAIMIYAGEFDALRKEYEPRLTYVDWC